VLQSPKEITDSVEWSDKGHQDYVVSKLPVFAPGLPGFKLRLDLQVHVRRLPMKSSFVLIWGERIFSLDVNPGLTHTNKVDGSRTIITGTHWHRWPCKVAQPDPRDFEHQQWFNLFLQNANVSFRGRYQHPPFLPEQINLDL
jgi:hypothetical protein